MRSLSILSLTALLTACASTRIFPKEDGTFTLIATSHSDSAAHDAALADGQKHCAQLGKQFAVIKIGSQYQGVDKDTQMVVGAVKDVISGNQYPHNTSNGSRPDDYKVQLDFRCK